MDKKKCTCIKLLHAPTDRSNLYHLKLLNKFCSAGMGKQTQFEMQQKEEDKAEKFNDYVAFTILNKNAAVNVSALCKKQIYSRGLNP